MKFTPELLGVPEEEQFKYFTFEVLYNEFNITKGFKIKNLKKYNDNYLVIRCVVQDGRKSMGNNSEVLKKDFYFELGGFY